MERALIFLVYSLSEHKSWSKEINPDLPCCGHGTVLELLAVAS